MTRSKAVLAGLLLFVPGCSDDSGADTDGNGSTGPSATSGQTTAMPASTGEPVDSTGAPGSETADPDGTAEGSTTASQDTDTDTDADTGTDTGTSTGQDETGTTGGMLEEVDCAEIPQTAVSTDLIVGPRGYHGLVITDDGMMIGSDGASLIQSSYGGVVSLFVPGVGYGEQMDWLPDGDFAYNTDDGASSRIGLDGSVLVIQSNVYAYGATTGPDGLVYVVGFNGISRIDPSNGNTESLFPAPQGFQELHSMGFSPDGTRAYIGTIGQDGTVLYVDFNAAMDPTTDLEVFATGVGQGSNWHDAVAVDACGNLYIPDFNSSNMYRVTPGGTVNVFWAPGQFELYGHGAVWGTGQDGWNAEALYVPQPYNELTVTEVVVGVPSSKYQGPVVNPEPMMP